MEKYIEKQRIVQIKNRITQFVGEYSDKPFSSSEINKALNFSKEDLMLFEQALEELELEGRIFKTRKKKYGIPEKMNLVMGTLHGNENGYGFVIPDQENSADIFIPESLMNGAMHNDRVVVRLNRSGVSDRRAEGEIIRVIHRANAIIIGTFDKSPNFGFVIPDDKRIANDVFIPKSKFEKATTGQKVVVKITKWPEKRRNAEGEIVEVIGSKNKPGVDILSIIKTYDLSEKFPEAVMEQTGRIEDKIQETVILGRRDLRQLKMVTIDSEDAKDLDDAVSIMRLPNGNYMLGVHIADVSHYVQADTPLDEEALERGTSVYLVDRVIPMLPPKLSNGICSLNPGVDRLAMSVFMEINNMGTVVNDEIVESVININERMTYTNVFKILNNSEKDKDILERYTELVEEFKMMKELMLILHEKRRQRGAIDFDFNEIKVKLDPSGVPISVGIREVNDAHRIIEEFMIACNEAVAQRFYWSRVPFVYRIHEYPSAEKMEAFKKFVSRMGYKLKLSSTLHPKVLQNLIEKCKGTNQERIVSTVMLRSLQKARYSDKNCGHFGLASQFYCHFTSPIRRYPDLIIHRIIKLHLKNQLIGTKYKYLEASLPEIARNCSLKERKAEEAERETVELKKVEYMKKFEGQQFDGIISNVTTFGLFVELPNTIEGLVKFGNIEDDYYVFDDENYCVVGERTKKKYKIGDPIKVILASANIQSRKIDFILGK